jgi:excisionase family DNA binding protein
VGEGLQPQEAADLLGVPRPHLNMLLDRDRIAYVKTECGDRRISRSALEEYQRTHSNARSLMMLAAAAEQDLDDED